MQDNNLTNDVFLASQIYPLIAQDDPELAFREAQTIKNRKTRRRAVSSILRSAMQEEPASAVGMLEQITNVSERKSMINQIGSHWASVDFDQAVQWLVTLDEKDQRLALEGMQHSLAQNDVDNAIRLLEQFPDSNSQNYKTQIAASLAHNQSIDDALAFIGRYEGTPEYSQLQQSVLSAALNAETDRAMQIIETLPEGDQKDQCYFQVAVQKA